MKRVYSVLLLLLGIILFIPALILVILLCLLPFHYKLKANNLQKTDVFFTIKYLFGLIRFKALYKDEKLDSGLYVFWFKIKTDKALQSFISTKTKDEKPPDEKKVMDSPTETADEPKKKSASGLISYAKKVIQVLTSSDGKTIIRQSLNAIKKIWRKLRPTKFLLKAEISLGDPADTAFLMGFYEVISAFLSLKKNIILSGDYNSDFKVKGITDLKGWFNVFNLLLPVLGVLLKNPTRNLLFKHIRKD